jgi:CDP-6-deoxy-D-xylo-4-hexulose-3-dehydrase
VCTLEQQRIQTRMLFAGNMVRQPCFDSMRAAAEAGRSDARYRVSGDLAATDRIMNDAFWVGIYPGLSAEMLEYVGRMIVVAVGGSG